jgi:hypothetical protein
MGYVFADSIGIHTSAQYALGFVVFLIFISCLKLPKLITVNGPKSEIYWFSFFPSFVCEYQNSFISHFNWLR